MDPLNGHPASDAVNPFEPETSNTEPCGSRPEPKTHAAVDPFQDPPSQSSTSTSFHPAGTVVRAIRRHEPGSDSELHLQIDDLVHLIDAPCEQTDASGAPRQAHWWLGVNRGFGFYNGTQGWFPSNCVTLERELAAEPETVLPEEPTSEADCKEGAEQGTLDAKEVGEQSLFKDLEQQAITKDQQQSLTVDTGISAQTDDPNAFVGVRMYALYTFHPGKTDELPLTPGDVIVPLETPEGGWWRGQFGDAVGWFPSAYVSPMPPAEKFNEPSLLQDSGKAKSTQNTTIVCPLVMPLVLPPSPTTTMERVTRSAADLAEGAENEQVASLPPKLSADSLSRTRHRARTSFVENSAGRLIDSRNEGGHKMPRARSSSAPPKFLDMIPGLNLQVETYLSPSELKRQRVQWEILMSERQYVKDLEYIVEKFKRPLESKKLIPKRTLDSIFSNIESIWEVNKAFLSTLESKVQASTELLPLYEPIDAISLRFVCYATYCGNHSNATQRLQNLVSGNKAFRSALEETYKLFGQSLDLASFLLKPIQRICKYPLLIRSILQETPEGHPEHGSWALVQKKMEGIMKVVNNAPATQPADLHEMFFDKLPSILGKSLLHVDDIKLVRESTIKTRTLMLFQDFVILTRRDWRDKLFIIAHAHLPSSRAQELRGARDDMQLNMLVLHMVPGVNSASSASSLAISEPKRFVLGFDSVHALKDWLGAYELLCNTAAAPIQVLADGSGTADPSALPFSDPHANDDAESIWHSSCASPSSMSSPCSPKAPGPGIRMISEETLTNQPMEWNTRRLSSDIQKDLVIDDHCRVAQVSEQKTASPAGTARRTQRAKSDVARSNTLPNRRHSAMPTLQTAAAGFKITSSDPCVSANGDPNVPQLRELERCHRIIAELRAALTLQRRASKAKDSRFEDMRAQLNRMRDAESAAQKATLVARQEAIAVRCKVTCVERECDALRRALHECEGEAKAQAQELGQLRAVVSNPVELAQDYQYLVGETQQIRGELRELQAELQLQQTQCRAAVENEARWRTAAARLKASQEDCEAVLQCIVNAVNSAETEDAPDSGLPDSPCHERPSRHFASNGSSRPKSASLDKSSQPVGSAVSSEASGTTSGLTKHALGALERIYDLRSQAWSAAQVQHLPARRQEQEELQRLRQENEQLRVRLEQEIRSRILPCIEL